ncbi:hypothetical protein SAMN02982929_05748 [Saccharopolyspora kobensis]|uniref:Uncharacterized protein n=1 Tax=Saccharopolyspora kobensis TaxID=146035 RepID=A0A1H6E8G9_9PSEU|nr:hypothetical protein [Saccharopolyspora kobensis]SEG93145.1 hypothetical protein SAMN02982929_05748 [Saccharopolyspora kobensis]SFD43076.1 hypothetical protein SAMN05216506_104277 [Saccharopolyspora kobensis]
MRTLLWIVGVVLLVQGLAPLVQSTFGTDPAESAFLVNLVPGAQPWTNLVLAALGAGAVLLAERNHRRRSRG